MEKLHQHHSLMFGILKYLQDFTRGMKHMTQLISLLPIHVLNNLLFTTNDWGGKGGLAWFKNIKLFQIDANITIASSIIEMIFQDRQGLLRFLPALPAELSEGKVSGLRARGGFEVGLEWSKGRLNSANIISFEGKPCKLKTKGLEKIRITCGGKEVKYNDDKDKGIISFNTGKGPRIPVDF